MSTSNKTAVLRTLHFYLALSAFCGLFSYIYECFSHGVYSSYMTLLLLFPLLGGAFPALLLQIVPAARRPSSAVKNAWGAAVATLTAGCCLTGVFEIYGSVSSLLYAYWIAGTILYVLAVAGYLFQYRRPK